MVLFEIYIAIYQQTSSKHYLIWFTETLQLYLVKPPISIFDTFCDVQSFVLFIFTEWFNPRYDARVLSQPVSTFNRTAWNGTRGGV